MPELRNPEAIASVAESLSHPVRVLALQCWEDAALTPNEIAEALGVKLGVVSYHVRCLAGAKLLREVAREPRRGAIAHRYRLTPKGVRALAAARALDNALVAR